jgi:hypothetical protein
MEDAKNRFGDKVSLKKYRSGNTIKIICIIGAIVIIPL